MSEKNLAAEELRKQICDLAPWHIDVDVAHGLTTATAVDVQGTGKGKLGLINTRNTFLRLMNAIYPEGLTGKSFVDAACNCGGYDFWAKDLGAERTFGFDVREHWIKQAKFLQQNRQGDTSGMTFKVMDLYDLPKEGEVSFDIAWFSGIFYHLPDPITGLKLVADRTREILYLSTSVVHEIDPEPMNGCLFASLEGTKSVMSGVHHLNWFPSGPKVLIHILNWLGFPETRILGYIKQVQRVYFTPEQQQRSKRGRIAIVAARERGRLKNIIQSEPQPNGSIRLARMKRARLAATPRRDAGTNREAAE